MLASSWRALGHHCGWGLGHRCRLVSSLPSSSQTLDYATTYHAPVMCQPCIDALLECQRGRDNHRSPLIFVDGTLGGGGHSAALLERLLPGDVVIGVDVDSTALKTATRRLAQYIHPTTTGKTANDKPLFIPLHCNFQDLTLQLLLTNMMKHPSVNTQTPNGQPSPLLLKDGIDGLLLDLGTSSHQINTAERGFSFRFHGPLDMRMGRQKKQQSQQQSTRHNSEISIPSAGDLCNTWNPQQLADIMVKYGDEPTDRALLIANAIVEHRPMVSTTDLVNAVTAALLQDTETMTLLKFTANPDTVETSSTTISQSRQQSKRLGLKPTLARVFQSLRIAVNEEDKVLETLLVEGCPTLIRPGGRLVVLSYHSLEDRIVRRVTRDGSAQWSADIDHEDHNTATANTAWRSVGTCQRTCASERKLNRRARTAVLRVAERVEVVVA